VLSREDTPTGQRALAGFPYHAGLPSRKVGPFVDRSSEAIRRRYHRCRGSFAPDCQALAATAVDETDLEIDGESGGGVNADRGPSTIGHPRNCRVTASGGRSGNGARSARGSASSRTEPGCLASDSPITRRRPRHGAGCDPRPPTVYLESETTSHVPLSGVADAVDRHNEGVHDGKAVAEVDPDLADRLADLVAEDMGLIEPSE
jgi:hypothetical protein